MNVMDVIGSLLARGTAGQLMLKQAGTAAVFRDLGGAQALAAPSWQRCPAWPPDLFAVVATLIDKSSCYMLAGPDVDDITAHRQYLTQAFAQAELWRLNYCAPGAVQQLWQKLLGSGHVELMSVKDDKALRHTLFLLLAIADEASNGMGWAPDPALAGAPATPNMLVKLVMTSLVDAVDLPAPNGHTNFVLPFIPASLCSLILPDIAVVLPKSTTASVGCTIRSMSHHLALLPSSLQVRPSWNLVDRSDNGNTKLQLLIVPYPFRLPETSFALRPGRSFLLKDMWTAEFFELHQTWLEQGVPALTGQMIVEQLLLPLLEQAQIESGSSEIHGIVMPECALSDELAWEVATSLRNSGTPIEFLITGVLVKPAPGMPAGSLPRNLARTYIFPKTKGEALVVCNQSKHHRWSLDKAQVQRYGLNFPERSPLAAADRATQWWEGIDIAQRDLPFYATRLGVSMAVLICEDLARTDPAMTVIRAVGPNLVIALLMDGPQLAVRWPARYATVLADDPGSSVLTLTCAALVDRANWLESRPVRSIALWRDAGGRTQELNLPRGHHGMCLTLTMQKFAQFTMDNRSDSTCTRRLSLSWAVPLAIASPPDWL